MNGIGYLWKIKPWNTVWNANYAHLLIKLKLSREMVVMHGHISSHICIWIDKMCICLWHIWLVFFWLSAPYQQHSLGFLLSPYSIANAWKYSTASKCRRKMLELDPSFHKLFYMQSTLLYLHLLWFCFINTGFLLFSQTISFSYKLYVDILFITIH